MIYRTFGAKVIKKFDFQRIKYVFSYFRTIFFMSSAYLSILLLTIAVFFLRRPGPHKSLLFDEHLTTST